MSKKVALMCGHGKSVDGSWDPGCAYGKYTEAGLMLPITKAAVKYLRSYGITVISDADSGNNKNMIADVRWANKQKTDIYVSIHCDYSKAPSGVMPLYVSSGGKKLATYLNKAVKSGMKMRSRGVIRRTDLWELNGTDMVACILETGAIKADLFTLKNRYDAYGKCIAKGICDYLGVEAKPYAEKPEKPATPVKKEEPKKQTKVLYRVRKTWKDAKSQVGAFSDLENAKIAADVNGLNVYGPKGKLIYKGKKSTPSKPVKKTVGDKVLDACLAQAKRMTKAKYGWQSHPTLKKSEDMGTCVTYVSCVLQILNVLESGEALWHNGRGYGTGKVTGANSNLEIKYRDNKTIASLKSKLQPGDIIILDDNKSGVKGSGGHIMIFTGKWKGDDPYVWDMEPSRYCVKNHKPRKYSGKRRVLATARVIKKLDLED